ncbi:Uncharacterised protein [Enterobacter hormaechei]|nr:Uncharacterised protein [Enterobacter hormaechei]
MCLTGIFPFIEPFRYTESATIFKIQLLKENMCNLICIFGNFVKHLKFQCHLAN